MSTHTHTAPDRRVALELLRLAPLAGALAWLAIAGYVLDLILAQ